MICFYDGASFSPVHIFPCDKTSSPKSSGSKLDLKTEHTGNDEVFRLLVNQSRTGTDSRRKARLRCLAVFCSSLTHLAFRTTLQLWFKVCLTQAVCIKRHPAHWMTVSDCPGRWCFGFVHTPEHSHTRTPSCSYATQVIFSMPAYI